MSGTPGTYDLGVHGGGHFTMGPIGSDFFASPGDPGFYFHAQIDRMWTLWQASDPAGRQDALSGTETILNIPPSPNVTLESVLRWGQLGVEMQVKDAMSTTAGAFCYVYE